MNFDTKHNPDHDDRIIGPHGFNPEECESYYDGCLCLHDIGCPAVVNPTVPSRDLSGEPVWPNCTCPDNTWWG